VPNEFQSYQNVQMKAQLGIYPLIEQVEPLQEGLNIYSQAFIVGYQEMMAEKLGLQVYDAQTDKALIDDLVKVLVLVETDMTIFYRLLADISTETELSDADLLIQLSAAYYPTSCNKYSSAASQACNFSFFALGKRNI
jgi:uncharacterized protein YdiU (UPF0061 family)